MGNHVMTTHQIWSCYMLKLQILKFFNFSLNAYLKFHFESEAKVNNSIGVQETKAVLKRRVRV